MLIRSNSQSKMSLREVVSLGIIFTLMIALTSMNLVFSNTFGETCGFLHPYLFEAQVSMVDPGGGLNWNSDLTHLPSDESDVRVLDSFLRVYDKNGNLLASDDDAIDGDRASGSTIERFGVSESGPVIVEMGSYGDSGSGRYEISVSSSQNSTNETLRLGSTVNGIIYAGEKNRIRYPLEVAEGEKLIVRASGLNNAQNELDTYLRLYTSSSSDTPVVENDDFGGISSAIIVQEAGSYTLEVGTYNDASGGTYSLSLESFVLDTVTGATLSLDTAIDNNLVPLQRIRHRISLEAGAHPVISLNGQDSDGYAMPLELRVYNEAGDLLTETSGDSIANSDIVMAEAGTLIIEVGSYQDAYEGHYDLYVTTNPEALPQTGGGAFQLRTVESLSIGAGGSAEMSAEMAAGERLQYPFTLTANQPIAIYASGLTPDGAVLDTVLHIYDENGAELISNDDYNGLGSGILNFSREQDSNLIIEVGSYGDSLAGTVSVQIQPYQMDVRVLDAINIGDTLEGRILPNQRLRYPLHLEAEESLSLFLQGVDADGLQLDTLVRILDSAGNELAKNDDITGISSNAGYNPSSGIENFTVTEASDLLIEVATFGDMYGGEFSLYVLRTMDDLPADAATRYAPVVAPVAIVDNGELAVGGTVSGSLEINQRQRYSVYLDSLDSIIINFSGESIFEGQSYPLYAHLSVYDSEEQVLAEAYPYEANDNVLVVSNSKNTPSSITIEVASEGDSYSGNFQFQVLENNKANFAQVYGITISDGRDLTLDTSPYVSGEINEGERIRHEIELAENQIIVVNFGGYARLDTIARLYSESNTQLAEAYSYGRSQGTLRYQATAEGIYAIEIGTSADEKSGQYEILVLEVADAGELSLDAPALSGDLKPNQRSQYSFYLEEGQTVDISVRQIVPESQGLSLFSWSRYALSSDPNAAQQWVSCLEYYGYVVDSAFRVNEYGISRFVLGTKIEDLCDPLREACQLEASVNLTVLGQILLYVLLPGLAIILPVITVLILQNDRVVYWVVGLIVVAIFVLTSSLLYVHLGTVSGISALQDFGAGIFGGTATGAAIAFMSKVLENFSERKSRQQEGENSSPAAQEILPPASTDAE